MYVEHIENVLGQTLRAVSQVHIYAFIYFCLTCLKVRGFSKSHAFKNYTILLQNRLHFKEINAMNIDFEIIFYVS